MARGGYRSSTDYQPSAAYPEPRHSQPEQSPASAYYPFRYSEPDHLRHQDSSPDQRSRMDPIQNQRSRQPTNETVNAGVGKVEGSEALAPEVLSQLTSQITANVLQQLKSANTEGPMPSHEVNPPTAPPHTTNGLPGATFAQSPESSPPANSNVVSPPSPHLVLDESLRTSPSSPYKSSADEDRRPLSRNSRPSPSIDAHHPDRPRPLPRRITEFTTLEKIWGPLFDESRSTPRLGQFLRGLALHLIEDYEPKHSLVISPAKMQKYYSDTKLSAELYPWQMVFDDQTSFISRFYREIEAQHHLVQDRSDKKPDIPALTPLGFERWSTLMLLAHPDQEFERLQKAVLDMPISNFDDRKERFPKEISRRLFPTAADHSVREKVRRAMVAHCHVSLPDQGSSGLEANAPQGSKRATTTFREDLMASATSSHTVPHHQTAPDHAPPTAPRARSVERERPPPTSGAPSEGAIEEEDEVLMPQPIERERKPYSTQPGGGRNFDHVHRSSTPPGNRSGAPPSANIPLLSSSNNKLGRSASVASNSSRSADQPRPQPLPIPRQSRNQPTAEAAPSVLESGPHPRHRTNSGSNHLFQPPGQPARRRSPSANTNAPGEYPHHHLHHRAADADGSQGLSTPYGMYNSSPGGAAGDVAIDDSRRFRDHERHHRPDRHDPHRSSMYDLSSRERDLRPRYQPSSGYNDSSRGHYSSDEDYYRSTGGRSHNGYDPPQYYR